RPASITRVSSVISDMRGNGGQCLRDPQPERSITEQLGALRERLPIPRLPQRTEQGAGKSRNVAVRHQVTGLRSEDLGGPADIGGEARCAGRESLGIDEAKPL